MAPVGVLGQDVPGSGIARAGFAGVQQRCVAKKDTLNAALSGVLGVKVVAA